MTKGQIKIKQFKYPHPIPKYETRGEFETEKLLQKYRVVARKNQIKDYINDNEIPYYPIAMSSYMHKETRRKIFNVFAMKLRLLLP